jgi:hypothetical protein
MVIARTDGDQSQSRQENAVGGAFLALEKGGRRAERAKTPECDQEKREVGNDIPEVGYAPDRTLVGELVVAQILGNRREQKEHPNGHGSESENECDTQAVKA